MDSAAGKLSQTDGLSRVYYLIDRYVESVEFVDGGTESLRKGRPGALLSELWQIVCMPSERGWIPLGR